MKTYSKGGNFPLTDETTPERPITFSRLLQGEVGTVSPRQLGHLLAEGQPEQSHSGYWREWRPSGEFRRQTAILKEWAKSRGRWIDSSELVKLALQLDKAAGTEHEVFIHPRLPFVLKVTINPFGIKGMTPGQYLQRWVDLGIVFPALEPRVVGVSETEGTPAMWVVQSFVRGEPYSTLPDGEARLEADMSAQGWARVSFSRYRHGETGVILDDAHTGNLIRGEDGSIWPFDVVVEELGALRDSTPE